MPKAKNDLSNVAEIELVYRNKQKLSERPHIKSSKDAYQLFLNTWDDGKLELQEHFKVALLDRKNTCLGISKIAEGGITGTVVDLRLIFAVAVKARATGIILAHNHPSGNLTPSVNDIQITKKCGRAGEQLDITVLDHIIVTRHGYTSFSDDGLIP